MAKRGEEFRTSIGGQALIEGIMMRGPLKQAVVVKTPDGLVKKEEEIKEGNGAFTKLPLVRGIFKFAASMASGVKAMNYSAQLQPEEEMEAPSGFDRWIEKTFGWEKAQNILMGLAMVLGVGFSIVLFFLLPTLLVGFVSDYVPYRIVCNLLEGLVRVGIFVVYLFLISRMKEIQRVFAYHGAEHKSIHCYEKGLPLTVENVRAQPRQHPRCGTSFLFVVMLVSMLVLLFIKWSNPLLRMVFRILLLPVIVGISYEINRWVGRHDNLLSRFLSAPGLWMQNLTTREPDTDMIEVGIAALEIVIPEEKGKDAW